MVQHLFTVVCRESKIDADTNNISILDIYEKLEFNVQLNEDAPQRKGEAPFALPFPFELTSTFYREKADLRHEEDIIAVIFDPNGTMLGETSMHIVMEKGITRTRTRLKSDSLPLTVSGTYQFEVHMKDKTGRNKKVGAVPLDVVINMQG